MDRCVLCFPPNSYEDSYFIYAPNYTKKKHLFTSILRTSSLCHSCNLRDKKLLYIGLNGCYGYLFNLLQLNISSNLCVDELRVLSLCYSLARSVNLKRISIYLHGFEEINLKRVLISLSLCPLKFLLIEGDLDRVYEDTTLEQEFEQYELNEEKLLCDKNETSKLKKSSHIYRKYRYISEVIRMNLTIKKFTLKLYDQFNNQEELKKQIEMGVQELILGLKDNLNIQVLKLQGVYLGNKGVELLMSVVINKQLYELNKRKQRSEKEKTLIDQHNGCIRVISLNNCYIDDEVGGQMILDFLNTLKSIADQILSIEYPLHNENNLIEQINIIPLLTTTTFVNNNTSTPYSLNSVLTNNESNTINSDNQKIWSDIYSEIGIAFFDVSNNQISQKKLSEIEELIKNHKVLGTHLQFCYS